MVTFTIPFELRRLASKQQLIFYNAMFACARSTLKAFGLNDKKFASELGMTGVLHTHSRRLDYHPHIHFIVPAGGINAARNEWRKRNGKYLFKEKNIAAVYRGMLLKALSEAGLKAPTTPRQWIVDCEAVGHGLPALKYLSRYLYKGVINDRAIVSDNGESVVFRYRESKSGEYKNREMKGEDFINLLLQHTLPKGFRRTRDYGFLHGNAKKLLHRVQLLLKVYLPLFMPEKKPCFTCSECAATLLIVGFIKPNHSSG